MMVDCASPRCAQDRRLLKKELLSWTKKVPILLGLEQIAEAYVGKNVFKVLMEPFQALESTEVEDWEPSSECQYCLSSNTSDKDTVDLDGDRDVSRSSSSPEADGIDYGQHYLPLRYPSSCSLDGSSIDNSNKPLDLSASSHYAETSSADHDGTSQPLVELKVPQITNKISKKKELGNKRSYTEEDLTAAVSDIRSGKLGTRRAAALYGIPRSTLRNKIFRIESENACERPCGSNLSMADLLQNMANNEVRKNDLSSDDWEHKLDLLRRKHDLNAGLERPFGMPPLFFNSHNLLDCEKAFSVSNPYDYEAKMPFLHELVRRFAEHRMEAERAQCLGLPFSSELAHHLEGGHMNSSPADLGMGAGAMSSGGLVDLKIPSYKPIRSYMNGSAANGLADLAAASKSHSPEGAMNGLSAASSKINDTLKNIISKTIAEKVRSRSQSLESDILSTNPLTNGYLKRELESCSDLSIPQTKHFKRESRSSEKSFPGDSKSDDTSQQPQKKTRPKRGQYRKYNSQLLLEAVRAVQRGEMSVHRAGSYFGVPHSTLEYKVKERHLMRQKKPRETRSKKAPSSTTPLNTPSTSTNIKSTSNDSMSRQDSGDEADDFRCRDEVASPEKSATSTSSQGGDSCHEMPMLANNNNAMHSTPRPDSDLLAHSVNSLLSSQTPSMPIPGTHPLASFYMTGALPLGFGWPPLLGGALPLGMPDPAMAACFPGYSAGSNINLSASDLLKKLQRKVEANTAKNNARKMTPSGSNHDAGQPVQGNQSNGSQVIVK